MSQLFSSIIIVCVGLLSLFLFLAALAEFLQFFRERQKSHAFVENTRFLKSHLIS